MKKPKTEASQAYVSLPPGVEMELRHWVDTTRVDPAEFIFPSERPGVPIWRENFLKRNLRPVAEAAGLGDLKVKFQMFRRTTATHAQSVGTVKDAQTILCHASPEMTMREYM